MLILAIDTSCDETSAAVSRDDHILSSVVYSQIEVHKKWGGVVPSLARINHEQNIDNVINIAFNRIKKNQKSKIKNQKFGKITLNDIDAVAVTVGPGLAIALEVGIRKAKEICEKFNKKFIAVNHMEGHLLSAFIKAESKIKNQKSKIKNKEDIANIENLNFPGVGVLISGGHTQIVKVNAIGKYEILGDTLDDAAGEAFDKVAKMLELGYPGGEIVEQLAKDGEPIYQLPIPMLKSHDYNFSFSGLKTAAMYFLRNYSGVKDKQFISDFCASFQFVLIDSIRRKLEKCLTDYPARIACGKALAGGPANFILCGGGVMNNLAIRKMIRQTAKKFGIPAYFPEKKYNSDNAAMIALAGFYKAKRNEFVRDINKVDRLPNWEIDDPIKN